MDIPIRDTQPSTKHHPLYKILTVNANECIHLHAFTIAMHVLYSSHFWLSCVIELQAARNHSLHWQTDHTAPSVLIALLLLWMNSQHWQSCLIYVPVQWMLTSSQQIYYTQPHQHWLFIHNSRQSVSAGRAVWSIWYSSGCLLSAERSIT